MLLFRRPSRPGTAPLIFNEQSGSAFAEINGQVAFDGMAVRGVGAATINGQVAFVGLEVQDFSFCGFNGQVAFDGLSVREIIGQAQAAAIVGFEGGEPVGFDLNVPVGPNAALQASADSALSRVASMAGAWERSAPLSVSPSVVYVPGQRLHTDTSAALQRMPLAGASAGLMLDSALATDGGASFGLQATMPRAAATSALTLEAVAAVSAWLAPAFIHPPRVARSAAFPWPDRRAVAAAIMGPMGIGRILSRRLNVPLRTGTALSRWRRPAIVPPPIPVPRRENRLLFVPGLRPANHLTFNRFAHFLRTIPVRRVYFVSTAFSLHRLSDGQELPAQSLSVALDDGAWCWALTSGIAEIDALDAVAQGDSGPVAVRAHINGNDWDFIIDDPEGEEQWDSDACTIHGRSPTALFDTPYYPDLPFSNASDRLFSQLAADLFIYNGVPLDVDVSVIGSRPDGQPPVSVADWLVPAGLWSFMGTPVAGLKRLAEVPGAMLTSAQIGQAFAVDLRYPIKPWNWNDATPWATIPRGYWSNRHPRRDTKPRYDLVVVGGDTAAGVIAPVQRDGSAGLWRAPDVVDRLISSATAASQRGLRVLADTGWQAVEVISMPLGPEIGLIPRGVLLEFQDKQTWRGMVRSVHVSGSLVGDGAADVEMILEVERHYG